MGKRLGKGKRGGNGENSAVVDLHKHDKGKVSSEVDKYLGTEQIDELSKEEDGEISEEIEEVIEVNGYEEMCGEEYEEEIFEVADEEIIEEIEEMVELEAEESDQEDVEDVREGLCEVEEQREDIGKKTNDEAPGVDELVEEWQSEDVQSNSDNKEVKEQFGDEPEEPDDEEVEEEMEDVEEERDVDIEEKLFEDEQVKEVVTQDQRTSLNKQEDSELNRNAESLGSVSKSSDSYITQPESCHIHSFSSEKKFSADVSQIQQGYSKCEPCLDNPVVTLKAESDNAKIVSDYSSQQQGANISSRKKKHSRWDSQSESHPKACKVGDEMGKKKKKSRWCCDQNHVEMPGLLEIPHFFSDKDKIMQDPEIQQLVDELKSINQEFVRVTGVNDPRNSELTILNGIMEASLRAKFVRQKQEIFSLLLKKGFDFKSLLDGKSSKSEKHFKKIYVPVKEYPDYNFVGLFFGPRGSNHKRMELESGAKIKLRGQGSIRDQTFKGTSELSRDEDLHILLEADNEVSLNSAAKMVEKLLIPLAETENELKRAQLRELAALKGKIAPDDLCEVCGDASHHTKHCPLIAGTPGANGHPVKGLSVFGAGLSSSGKINSVDAFSGGQLSMGRLSSKKIDDRKLFVSQLPYSVDDNRLMELCCQYGDVHEARVVKDADTGLSQGYAFVKYHHPADAAKAMKHMHGFPLEGRTLTVEISGLRIKTSTSTDPEKTTGYQTSQESQMSTTPSNRQVASSFPWPSAPVQHYASSLSTTVSVLHPVTSCLASTVSSPATPINSPTDRANFAGNLEQLPSPFSLQLGRSSSIFSSRSASAPKNQAAFGSHVYPSFTATTGSNPMVGPPIIGRRLSPLGRPPLVSPAAESLNFPGNPDCFRSRFL